jgi:uncharacterized protein YyaL (SSP411 family)
MLVRGPVPGLIVFETSRMDRTKRKDLLLDSFAAVAERLDNAYLFIGGGPEDSETFAQLQERKKSLPILEGRGLIDGRATAYVCVDFTCRPPVTDPATLWEVIG